MSSHNYGIPKLTSTSNNFLEYMAILKLVLLSKGLWHVVDPSAAIVTKPKIKIEKVDKESETYVAPTEDEQEDLLFNAVALQNHEVVLLMSHSLDFSLHHLTNPFPVPSLDRLGYTVYKAIDNHFRQSNEWAKQEIKGRWESLTLVNPRETYNKITALFHEGITAGCEWTPYDAAIKYAALIQPINSAYIPIYMAVMNNPLSTLESIWPSVVSTNMLLRITAAPPPSAASTYCSLLLPSPKDNDTHPNPPLPDWTKDNRPRTLRWGKPNGPH